MTRAKKGGLGKGLDALFMDNETADSGIVTLRLSEIEPNRDQPRKVFSEEALNELADSIREHGVPVVHRRLSAGCRRAPMESQPDGRSARGAGRHPRYG